MRRNMDSKFAVNLPYPEISVNEKNKNYSNIILQNYAGQNSEFTAVAQYNYHEIAIFNDYPVVSNAIKGIARVEMYHLQILGELIVLLGGDPKYRIYKKKTECYWSPKFIDFNKELKTLLTNDLNSEISSIKQYEKAISLIDDENIVLIIKRIILDEEYHVKIFKELIQKYTK